jgi:dolichol-phosphate mannosyltransferase
VTITSQGEWDTSPMNEQAMLVIVPTYNEAESAPRLITALLEVLPALHILIVDDASPDGTADICQKIADADSFGRVHILRRTGKRGFSSAYIAGFKWGLAKDYGALIQMDADGSHRPIDLVTLISKFEGNSSIDCIIGSRWTKGGSVVNWPKHREVLSRTANTYAKIVLGIKVNDMTAGFRIYRKNLLEKIDFENVISDGYCFQIELLIKIVTLGARVVEAPITFMEREFGVSKMRTNIIFEAISRVTFWGLQRALKIGGRNNAR